MNACNRHFIYECNSLLGDGERSHQTDQGLGSGACCLFRGWATPAELRVLGEAHHREAEGRAGLHLPHPGWGASSA